MFTKGKASTRPAVVLFIRSSSVDGYLISPQKEVSYRVHTELPFQKEIDVEHYRKTMLAALLDSCMKLSSEGVAPYAARFGHSGLSGIYVILSAPWHQPLIACVGIHKEKAFTVNERMIRDAADDELEGHLKTLKEEVGDDIEVIARDLSRFSINGYHTDHPFGLSGMRVTAQLTASAMGSEVKRAIEEVVEKVFNEDHPRLLTSMALLSEQIRGHGEGGNALILESHGEISELTLFEEGMVAGRSTFPLGTHTLVRTFQKSSEMTPEEAETAIIMEGTKAGAHSKAKLEAIAVAKEDWCKGLADAIAQITVETQPPRTLQLASDPRWLPWFTEAIEQSTTIASQVGNHPQVLPVSSAIAVKSGDGTARGDYASDLSLLAVDSIHSKS